jgi:hypothetical protein
VITVRKARPRRPIRSAAWQCLPTGFRRGRSRLPADRARELADGGEKLGPRPWARNLRASQPRASRFLALRAYRSGGQALARSTATSIRECSHPGLAAPCPDSIASRRSRSASGLIGQAGGRRRRRPTPADRPQRSGVRRQQIVRSEYALVVLPSIGSNAPNGGLALPAKLAILASCHRKRQEPEFYMASPTQSLNNN